MNSEFFSIELKGPVEILTITRAKALNALNFQLLRELREAFLAFKEDGSRRVIIVTGEGEKAFCAGADISELRGRHISEEKRGHLIGQDAFNVLENLGKPSIAAINGYALGGGLEMALACTFRLASPNARLGLPEIDLGLIPGYGGTQRLPRLIGQAKAFEIILLGKPINAQEAERIGLVYKVVEQPQLIDECMALAQTLCQKSAMTLSLAMEAILRGRDLPLRDGLGLEADLGTMAYNTEDGREGLVAFMEKRRPNFKGR